MSLEAKKKFNVKIHTDDRGDLAPINGIDLPFDIKRTFFVYNVPEGCKRGGHAHRKTEQNLICLNGKISVKLTTKNENKVFLLRKGEAIAQKPYEWADITFEEKGSILQVVCSTDYDENDYIRDFGVFMKEVVSL